MRRACEHLKPKNRAQDGGLHIKTLLPSAMCIKGKGNGCLSQFLARTLYELNNR